jgi:hypothetical protein
MKGHVEPPEWYIENYNTVLITTGQACTVHAAIFSKGRRRSQNYRRPRISVKPCNFAD